MLSDGFGVRQHSNVRGKCRQCGRLKACPTCKERTLHRVASHWPGVRWDYQCAAGCSKVVEIGKAFTAEMRSTLARPA